MKKRNYLWGVLIVVLVVGALSFSFLGGDSLQGRLFPRIRPWAENFDPNPGIMVTEDQEVTFKWNQGYGSARLYTIEGAKLCIRNIGDVQYQYCAIDWENPLQNYFTFDANEWDNLKYMIFGDRDIKSILKMDWRIIMVGKNRAGNPVYFYSDPWPFFLDTTH